MVCTVGTGSTAAASPPGMVGTVMAYVCTLLQYQQYRKRASSMRTTVPYFDYCVDL